MHRQSVGGTEQAGPAGASECVIGLAREREVDLIVTGSHGRTELERALLGSTSERILNATPRAVLVTKTG